MGFLLNYMYMCLFLFVGLTLKVMLHMFECTRLVEITIQEHMIGTIHTISRRARETVADPA